MKCYGNFIINFSYKIDGVLKYMLHIMCIPLGFHKMYLLCPCPQFLLYKVQSPSELCDPDNKTKYINSVSCINSVNSVKVHLYLNDNVQTFVLNENLIYLGIKKDVFWFEISKNKINRPKMKIQMKLIKHFIKNSKHKQKFDLKLFFTVNSNLH